MQSAIFYKREYCKVLVLSSGGVVTGVTQLTTARALRESWHFIGIGGIGMSGIAYLLAKQGANVSGSDLKPNFQTERLAKLGVEIFYGHRAENLVLTPDTLQRVVYSTAIDPSNPEFITAQTHHLPLLHRAQVLAHLAADFKTLGISGTHGKTTTSSMLGCLLADGALDPMVVVGGEVRSLGGNARFGQGAYFVAEVDESDGSLIQFHPHTAVVTNIEADHLDHYCDLEAIITAFRQFVQQSEQAVFGLDSPGVETLITTTDTPWIGYSLHGHPKARYTADQIVYAATGTTARILDWGHPLGTLQLKVTASHNLSNALAALAVARELGLDFETIALSLAQFEGAERRFQQRGERQGVLFVDDYAHHPSEIQATLASARLFQRRVVAIFQPHRYSRTQALFTDFSTCFAGADHVVLTDIYSAGEDNTHNITGEDLFRAVAEHHPSVHYCPSLGATREYLAIVLTSGDLALFLGAGNLNSVIPLLLAAP
jgi:UDP-N-acetylmuramate--alanine ligase